MFQIKKTVAGNIFMRVIKVRDRQTKTWIFVTYKLPLISKITDGKIREIVAYKNYFEDFLTKQPVKVQDKIFKILEAIETLERIPTKYLKYIVGTNGLYEVRIQLATDIWRIFCFFDNGQLVILLNGLKKRHRRHLRVRLKRQ
jgi:phage-related protein